MKTIAMIFAIVGSSGLACAQSPPSPGAETVARVQACKKLITENLEAFQRCMLNQPVTEPLKKAALPSSLSDEQINQAIARGNGKSHEIGLTLHDEGTAFKAGLSGALNDCDTCGVSGYSIIVYGPEQWIELQAAIVKKSMLPFSITDVTEEMRQPLLRVNALPSRATYITGAGLSQSSSVERVVLTDTERQTIIQPFDIDHGLVKDSSAFRSVGYQSVSASFMMHDVSDLRATDKKREFFIVVVGAKQNKYFKVKERFFHVLFGNNVGTN